MTLALQNLSVSRGDQYLFKALSCSIRAGQCLHVTGANGSGKTTLLRAMVGLIKSDSGSLTWHQTVIKNTAHIATFLGHSDGIKNELTAAENILFWLQLDGLKADEETVDQQLIQMQLLAFADIPASKLSFGQRRRLAFTRLLGRTKPIWILDEPFTGIDHAGQQLIQRLCLDHLQQQGMVILTNHNSLQSSLLKSNLVELDLTQFAPQKKVSNER